VLATGPRRQIGLVVADTLYGQTLWRGALVHPTGAVDVPSAIATASLDDTPYALVGGVGTVNGVSTPVLAVVSLAPLVESGAAPVVVALLALPHAVGDILVTGQTAIVSGDRGSVDANGQPGVATLVDLTLPVQPRIVGSLGGVGSRLALTADNILLSTERAFVKGEGTPLGGVRTTTLGQVTVISRVTENPVIVAIDRRSTEPQLIEYRVIPPPTAGAIKSAELEIVRNGGVVQTFPVALDDAGRGRTTLPVGTLYPAATTVQARLVVNRDEPEAPRVFARRLEGEPFVILPDEPLAISTDEEPLDVAAVNQAVIRRLHESRETPYQAPTLTFRITAASGATVTPVSEAAGTGIYLTSLKPAPSAGSTHQVEALIGSTVMARTAPITVEAGVANFGVLVPERMGQIPADGTTEINLTLTSLTDTAGNPVADGTEVLWSIVEGEGGALLSDYTTVVGGQAVNRYRAGIEPGQVVVRASTSEVERDVVITHERLTVTLTIAGGQLHATVGSAAGAPADGTPVFFGSSRGTVISESTLTDGQASAAYLEPFSRSGEPTRSRAHVFATVGRSRGDKHFQLSELQQGPPLEGFTIMFDRERIIGNTTSGATIPLGPEDPVAALGGVFQTGTPVAVYESHAMARVQGGTPGQAVPLALGSMRYPNVEPVAAYPFDRLGVTDPETGTDSPGLSADLFGRLPAMLPAAGVTVDTSDQRFAPTYHFSGGALIVPDAPDLHLADNFGFNGWVRFDELSAGQTILEKPGSFGISLTDDGSARLAFHVIANGQRTTVLSTASVSSGVWYYFAAHLKNGTPHLSLSDTDGRDIVQVGTVAGPVDVTPEPLRIGAGLVGNLDELVFYDFSRPHLLTFADGTVQTTVVLDGEGAANVAVLSTGSLGGTSPVAYGDPFGRPGIPDHGPAIADSESGSFIVQADGGVAREYGHDAFSLRLRTGAIQIYQAPEPTTQVFIEKPLGFIVIESLSLSFEQCVEGMLAGEDAEWSQVGCDFFGGFLPFVGGYQTLRDGYKTAQRFVEGKQTTTDYIVAGGIVATALIASIPAVKPAITVIKRAVSSVDVRTQKLLTAEGLEIGARAAAGAAPSAGAVARVAADGHDLARAAVRELLDEADSPSVKSALDELGKVHRLEDLALVLKGIRDDARFGHAVMANVARALTRLPGPVSPRAMRGMAAFMKMAPRAPGKRIHNVWRHLQHETSGLPDDAARLAVMDSMFTWIDEGVSKNIPGFERLVQKGPGTIRNGTSGFYNTLQHLAVDLKWQGIAEIEASANARFIDILLDGGIKRELKNFIPGAKFREGFRSEIWKDVREATAAARARGGSQTVLAEELRKLEYFFRGTQAQMEEMTRLVREEMRQALPEHMKTLADAVIINYLKRPVPY